MARERRHRRTAAAVLAGMAAVPLLLPLLTPQAAEAASQPWWRPQALAGQRVDAVAVVDGTLSVTVDGRLLVSRDGGASFAPATPVARVGRPAGWAIVAGRVLAPGPGGVLRPDTRAPYLGAAAHLIAVPALLPGVVVAAGDDGHIWRRAPDGSWATALVLLPAGGLAGTPRVTALAAFSAPLTGAVYLGTDGYGVLLSSDGGDDWIRAGPGLPPRVLGLATDDGRRTLYAATADGLWAHRLMPLPAPPVYRDRALALRLLGTALVSLGAAALGALALVRLVPGRRRAVR